MLEDGIAAAIREATVWALPILFAVPLHEAAHGLVAYRLGDDTAYRQGRVTLNPLRHIDPFGTVVLPLLLLLAHSPFLFGYAKPVPVAFNRLRHPRRDTVLVAAAGPAMNILLALDLGPADPCVAVRLPRVASGPGRCKPCSIDVAEFRPGGVQHDSACHRSMAEGSRSACCPAGPGLPLARVERLWDADLAGRADWPPDAGARPRHGPELLQRLLLPPIDFLAYNAILSITGLGLTLNYHGPG